MLINLILMLQKCGLRFACSTSINTMRMKKVTAFFWVAFFINRSGVKIHLNEVADAGRK